MTNFKEINKRYTEIVAEYIGKGYTINTTSMNGSQGEIAKVDLTNGEEIIRVMINSFFSYGAGHDGGVEIIIGKSTDNVKPNSSDNWNTVWNGKLKVLHSEKFFKLYTDRQHETVYGTEEEAQAIADKKFERYCRRSAKASAPEMNEKKREIAKRIIRREFGAKRIAEADVKISKNGKKYIVSYKGKTYTLR